jgi:proteic killer suppression protein
LVLIYFRDPKLAKICASQKDLVRRFGPRQGACIAQRISELRALSSLGAALALPHLKLHKLSSRGHEQFSLTLIQPYRLILECADDPVPRRSDGGIDPDAVTEVIIVEVVDYH